MEPGRKKGVCGITFMLLRMVWVGSVEMSIESTRTWPSWVLRRRRRTDTRVDFPDPVRPQTRILWPAGAVKLTFFKAGLEAALFIVLAMNIPVDFVTHL